MNAVCFVMAVVNGGIAAWNGAIYVQNRNPLSLVAFAVSVICTLWMLILATKSS